MNPVTELALLGLKPKSPTITVGPVLVTADAAITPKLAAVPKGTVCALTAREANNKSPAKFVAARCAYLPTDLFIDLPLPVSSFEFVTRPPKTKPALHAIVINLALAKFSSLLATAHKLRKILESHVSAGSEPSTPI